MVLNIILCLVSVHVWGECQRTLRQLSRLVTLTIPKPSLLAPQLIGSKGPQVGSFFNFAFAPQHILNTRSMTWMVSILVPTIAVIFDVTGKVYSNMFYPTQTQIHMEIAAGERK
jgi:hypothetical protein